MIGLHWIQIIHAVNNVTTHYHEKDSLIVTVSPYKTYNASYTMRPARFIFPPTTSSPHIERFEINALYSM